MEETVEKTKTTDIISIHWGDNTNCHIEETVIAKIQCLNWRRTFRGIRISLGDQNLL